MIKHMTDIKLKCNLIDTYHILENKNEKEYSDTIKYCKFSKKEGPKMKKAISYLITIMMVFTMMPSIAFASENNDAAVLSMYYDDHKDMTGKNVEIIDAGAPTSYQVGYGVAADTRDETVIKMEGSTLVAVGTGTAKISVDGQVQEVNVSAAPISVLLLIGQSNMQGNEGNLNQSIVCEEGQVYATYGNAGVMNPSNASNYAASALTGEKSNINVNGNTSYLNTYPINMLTEDGAGKEGADSGFAYQWVKETGEKVWVINAAHGGSAIESWQENGSNYLEAKNLFNACMDTLKKEIAAGHYTLSHMLYYWCQGCSDRTQSAEWYTNKYLAMHNNLKTQLAYDANKTFEFGGIIPVHGGAGSEVPVGYRSDRYTEASSLPYFQNFRALEMVGPRASQIWMANNPELYDIYITCTIADGWVTMPDGTNGVADYFTSHYDEGRVDYPTQTPQTEKWRTPTTSAEVKDNIHYNQIGYNEVGRECVRNTMYILGYKDKSDITPEVNYYNWTGYQEVSEINAATQPGSTSLVVPVVTPCYMSKDVTYKTNNLLNYKYYDLIDSTGHGGSVTASTGEGVKVNTSNGHTIVPIPDKPANCNDGGHTGGTKCSTCNMILEEPAYSDTPNHKMSDDYVVTLPATMNREGHKAICCTICGAVSENSIDIPQIKSATMAALAYNGSIRKPDPKVINYYKNTRLKNGVDYTVVYKNAKATKVVKPKLVGTYTAVIKFKGNYGGSVNRSFNINPKATAITKVTKPAKKQIKVTWQKRTEQVTGYQVRYSVSKDFKTYGQKRVSSNKTTTHTFKNLKDKKRYYVKVRTYKTVNGKDYYSAWSEPWIVTTK